MHMHACAIIAELEHSPSTQSFIRDQPSYCHVVAYNTHNLKESFSKRIKDGNAEDTMEEFKKSSTLNTLPSCIISLTGGMSKAIQIANV